ncbi:hypothetical protein [Polynucleobacter sp. UK-Kesae-W10]|uniref:hypothetical protein n=1 Tax=Polynucleobacter sp. UK-Kesae-W10 TaxID=1819738 RepID=UPI001C0AFBF1|nr:hypothetical protein [Polynucleobacter sp. UK-Kesae-W10]MBU3576924.1 hypothetical protein [Polynucleobacter sp. UK-Kesae-W10]
MGKLANWTLALAQKTVTRLDRQQESVKVFLKHDYEFSIANTRLVSSRGLLANCDVKSSNPISSEVDQTYLDSIPRQVGALEHLDRPVSIYVCSDGLSYFAQNILPKLQQVFVLVSGDSDLAISAKTLGGDFEAIANHPLLSVWFAQNTDETHAKVHPLPIGLDFHSRWRDAQIWGGGFILPSMQEAELRHILSQSPPWTKRKMLAYCNWGVSVDRGDRMQCKEQMHPQAYFYQTQRSSRTDTWVEQAQYAFVTSPSGAGLDCHRTWEALALGCVPIVKRSLMTEVFEQLPVMVVDNWAQVNPQLLHSEAARLSAQTFDFSKLLLSYWIHRIHQADVMPSLCLTLNQTQNLLI